MLKRDPYAVLGVQRDAGQDEIKAAWRTLAKSVHPDQNQDDPFAAIRFTEAGRAYELLRDPDKRSRYDRAHREAEIRREMELRRMERMRRQQSARKAQSEKSEKAQGAAESAEDMVSRIFGVDARQQQPAGDAPPPPQPSASAERQAVPGPQDSGAENAAVVPATRRAAAATDIISAIVRRIRGSRPVVEKAPDLVCDITVTIEDLLKQSRLTLDINGELLKVPLAAGTTEGTVIRLKEQGHRINDLKRGDAMITVRVAPGAFRVDGFDLRTTLPVSIENAVLGCETTIPGPHGDDLPVTVPAWSSSDHVIHIDDHGLAGSDGKRGKLIVEIRLLLWERPDDKMIDLMRSLREGLYL
ncbi:J domain-containing protein [Rhizobium sp. ARZ01]|uniref:DnaJ domain-containing protein n=1 Tax=Rhizobium sp. ARZ01 TaxID=2769313 RepID=UPI001786C9AE|nr:DnaJ domain-containing protein [Rhizobium sp. ARZ01]MBD9371294.1 J domain-containing protein [Rhizobium sp. ARZ01]